MEQLMMRHKVRYVLSHFYMFRNHQSVDLCMKLVLKAANTKTWTNAKKRQKSGSTALINQTLTGIWARER